MVPFEAFGVEPDESEADAWADEVADAIMSAMEAEQDVAPFGVPDGS